MLFFSSQLTGNMTQVPGAMHLTEPSGLPDILYLQIIKGEGNSDFIPESYSHAEFI